MLLLLLAGDTHNNLPHNTILLSFHVDSRFVSLLRAKRVSDPLRTQEDEASAYKFQQYICRAECIALLHFPRVNSTFCHCR